MTMDQSTFFRKTTTQSGNAEGVCGPESTLSQCGSHFNRVAKISTQCRSKATNQCCNEIGKWNGVRVGQMPQEEGIVLAMVRTNEEFRREPQYIDVLSRMQVCLQWKKLAKIRTRSTIKADGDNLPLTGIRAAGWATSSPAQP